MTLFLLFGVLCSLILSAFFSGTETAAYSVNQLLLEKDCNDGNPAAGRVRRCLRDMPLCLAVILIGNNVVNSLGTQLFTDYLLFHRVANVEFWSTVFLAPVFFFFGETLPKQLAYVYANRLLLDGSRVFAVLECLLWPLAWCLGTLGKTVTAFLRFCGLRPLRSTGRAALSASWESFYEDGRLSPVQAELGNRILEAEDRDVDEVMLPLAKVCRVKENLAAMRACHVIHAQRRSRALLVDEQGLFTGRMLTVNSVLRHPEPEALKAADCSRPVPVLQSGTSLPEALRRMRRAGAQLALVCKAGNEHEFIGAVPLNRLVGAFVSGVAEGKWNL